MFLKSNSSCLMSNFPADILIIDDERQIRRLLNLTLTGAGYHVRECENGQLGLRETALKRPDAIILDLGLPDMDGMEILSRLRKWSGMPVVVISARSHEKDKVEALDLGADDYITKPFGTSEMLARIRAAIRHSRAGYQGPAGGMTGVFEAKDLLIDVGQVNVKATTEEGLGFTGSGEGISSQAICLVTTPFDLTAQAMQGGCGSCSGCPKS